MAVEEPKPRSGQNVADQNADSTDKWITYSGDETKPFKCGYEGCGRTYVRKHTLRRHFVTHIGDSQFRCYAEDCTGAIRYCDSQALARHIHREHTIKRPFTCEICNNQFVRVDHLFTHRRNVHFVKDEQKQPQNSATDKWIMYSGDETRPFQCGYEVCGKTYITKQALRRHFVSHIGDSQFRCYTGDCAGRIRYWDKQALARHIRTKHKIERPFKCDICNRRFVKLHYFFAHRRNVHAVKDKQKQPRNPDPTDKWIIYSGDTTSPFQCGYEGCGKRYTRKHDLHKHFVSHIGDSQFRCYYGDCAGRIRYWDKQALARHIHTKHKIERPFKCDICTNGFMRSDHLKRHKEKAHSTEKE